MPGTDNTLKQHTLGGAVGIAVLVFALAYRFFPGLLHVAPQAQVQTETTAPARATPWSAQRGEPAPTSAPSEGDSERISPTEAMAMGPPAPTTKEVAGLLAKARRAEEQGRLLEPKGASAVALYAQVLEKDSANSSAELALERIAGAIRDWTVAAIDRGDEAEARRYATAFSELPHSEEELTALRARLKTLREVTPLLAAAAERLKSGRIEGTDDDNALALYRKVLAQDPTNRIADQGLEQIERGYLDRALGAAAQDDFGGADAILADAARIRPGSVALLDTRSRVEGIRRQRAESVFAQARSALDGGETDLAEQLAAKAQAISPDLGGIDEFEQRLRNARLYASFAPGQVIRDRYLDIGGEGPSMVVVRTGSFVMGSPADETGHRDNEEPQRQVQIGAGFAMALSELSVGQFREFVRATNYVTDAERLGSASVYDEATGRMGDRRGITWQNDYRGSRAGDDLPVINVSWNDAQAYARWLAERTGKRYRLPSEAEFEYVLRAGSTTRYGWGDGDPDKVVANLTGDGDRSPTKRSWGRAFPHYSDGYWGPAPVRSFPANPFGLYDVDGNVSEWVEDCWHDNYVRAPRDGRAWVNPGCGARVVRGGSWGSAPEQVRSAYRLSAAPDTRSARVGFRVVRDL